MRLTGSPRAGIDIPASFSRIHRGTEHAIARPGPRGRAARLPALLRSMLAKLADRVAERQSVTRATKVGVRW